jgi:hypothetical protein
MSDTPLVQSTAEAGQPVKILVQSAEPPPVDPNSPEERNELIPQENWQTDPLFYEISNFLNLESREHGAMAEKVAAITDYAIREAGSNKPEDILNAIRSLEDRLQPPEWGVRRINHIYKFLRLESIYDAHKKALGAYTRTGKWG